MRSDKIIFLEITSYIGISIGAIHYYGKLRADKIMVESVELKRKLSKRAAAKLSKQHGDGFTYPPGMMHHSFDTKDEIRELALKTYKNHFPGAFILIEGNPVYIEPHPILDAPEEIKTVGAELLAEAIKIDYWEGNSPKRMDELSDQWSALLKKMREEKNG